MTEVAYRKATICVAVDEPLEMAAVGEWLRRWGGSLRHLKEYGCGCCVRLYDVLAPSGALDELPDALLADSDWTKGGGK